jgi:hypothetical protein
MFIILGFHEVYLNTPKKEYSIAFYPFIAAVVEGHRLISTEELHGMVKRNRGDRPFPKKAVGVLKYALLEKKEIPYKPKFGTRPSKLEHAAIWDEYFDILTEVNVDTEPRKRTGDTPEYFEDGTYAMGVPNDEAGKGRTIYSSPPSSKRIKK